MDKCLDLITFSLLPPVSHPISFSYPQFFFSSSPSFPPPAFPSLVFLLPPSGILLVHPYIQQVLRFGLRIPIPSANLHLKPGLYLLLQPAAQLLDAQHNPFRGPDCGRVQAATHTTATLPAHRAPETDFGGAKPSKKVDWVAKGAVMLVKNQGFCGSCWAFASTGAMESAWFIKYRQLLPFSEQQIIDCLFPYESFGCCEGYDTSAYEFVRIIELPLRKNIRIVDKSSWWE
jgi:hypothetical protein